MAGKAEQDEWVEQVLGYRINPPGADDAALAARLDSVTQDIGSLDEADRAGLATSLAAAQAAIADGAPGAAALLGSLEEAAAHAVSAARGRVAAQTNKRGTGYRKLLLQWRGVRTDVANNLAAIGHAMLARKDVQTDPRFEQVSTAISSITQLVPQFDARLEDLLDAAIDGQAAEDAPKLLREAVSTIEQYRQQLGAASGLLAMEKFAAGDLKLKLGLHSTLDQTLVSLRHELAADL
jgi:hypothetical protein